MGLFESFSSFTEGFTSVLGGASSFLGQVGSVKNSITGLNSTSSNQFISSGSIPFALGLNSGSGMSLSGPTQGPALAAGSGMNNTTLLLIVAALVLLMVVFMSMK